MVRPLARSFVCAITAPLGYRRSRRPRCLYVSNEFHRQSLPVGQHRREARREGAHFAREHDFTLGVQGISDGLPPGKDRLSGLRQLAVGGVADGSSVFELAGDAFDLCPNGMRTAVTPSIKRPSPASTTTVCLSMASSFSGQGGFRAIWARTKAAM